MKREELDFTIPAAQITTGTLCHNVLTYCITDGTNRLDFDVRHSQPPRARSRPAGPVRDARIVRLAAKDSTADDVCCFFVCSGIVSVAEEGVEVDVLSRGGARTSPELVGLAAAFSPSLTALSSSATILAFDEPNFTKWFLTTDKQRDYWTRRARGENRPR